MRLSLPLFGRWSSYKSTKPMKKQVFENTQQVYKKNLHTQYVWQYNLSPFLYGCFCLRKSLLIKQFKAEIGIPTLACIRECVQAFLTYKTLSLTIRTVYTREIKSHLLWEAAWPNGGGAGLEIGRSWVQIPVCALSGVVFRSPDFDSSAMTCSASLSVGFLKMLYL